jgi:acetyl-CoA synthetase
MSAIQSVLVENRVFPPSEAMVKAARISGMGAYQALYDEAEKDFEGFWARRAREHLVWAKPFTQVLDDSNKPFYKWFADGQLNASANCLDKHMGTPVENKTAIIFEADGGEVTKVTYKELLARVSQFANGLKAHGIKKGDRVLVYMPMTIEGLVAMQACARIGATHSVVFGGFSAKAVQERIHDAGAVAVITANYQMRGGKELALKAIVDEALSLGGCDSIKNVIVYERTQDRRAVGMVEGRDKTFTQMLQGQSTECEPEMVDAEHPLFVLYTSGSTGKPKGVQHATGGYLLWAKLTMEWTFDLKDSDVFWCTADIGWVTGHSYIVYGPLAAGATQIVFEGVPTYPDAARFWQMIERHKVQHLLHRAHGHPFADQGRRDQREVHPKHHDLSSLRTPGQRGRADQPGGLDVVLPERRRRALPDRRHLLADRDRWPHDHAVAGRHAAGAGLLHACRCPGIFAGHRRRDGQRRAQRLGRHPGRQEALAQHDPHHLGRPGALQEELLPRRAQGLLPGRRRRHARAPSAATSRVTGRIDDVLNVSGHRMGTMEIESALVAKTELVAEAAVVGTPGRLDGRGDLRLRGAQARCPTGDEAKADRQGAARLGGQGDRPRSPSPRKSASATTCPRRAAARSCAACCAAWPRASPITQDISTLGKPRHPGAAGASQLMQAMSQGRARARCRPD